MTLVISYPPVNSANATSERFQRSFTDVQEYSASEVNLKLSHIINIIVKHAMQYEGTQCK